MSNSQGKLKYATTEEAREANRKKTLENYHKKKVIEKENNLPNIESKIERYVLNPTTSCVEIFIAGSILRLTFPQKDLERVK